MGIYFEFPHFTIHSAKRFPSQSDENTLHIKALWKASFLECFLCKMPMLLKAARPFGNIISAIIKNVETQRAYRKLISICPIFCHLGYTSTLSHLHLIMHIQFICPFNHRCFARCRKPMCFIEFPCLLVLGNDP